MQQGMMMMPAQHAHMMPAQHQHMFPSWHSHHAQGHYHAYPPPMIAQQYAYPYADYPQYVDMTSFQQSYAPQTQRVATYDDGLGGSFGNGGVVYGGGYGNGGYSGGGYGGGAWPNQGFWANGTNWCGMERNMCMIMIIIIIAIMLIVAIALAIYYGTRDGDDDDYYYQQYGQPGK